MFGLWTSQPVPDGDLHPMGLLLGAVASMVILVISVAVGGVKARGAGEVVDLLVASFALLLPRRVVDEVYGDWLERTATTRSTSTCLLLHFWMAFKVAGLLAYHAVHHLVSVFFHRRGAGR
jgi:hypothetical protein